MMTAVLFAVLGACTPDSPTEPTMEGAPFEAIASAAVGDLSVLAVTDSTVTVRWTQVVNSAGTLSSYRLKYAKPPFNWSTATIGCERTMSGTTVGAQASCTVTGLSSGTRYDLQLMSFGLTSTGVWQGAVYSNLVSTTTTVPVINAGTVADLAVTAATDSSLTVRWTQVNDGTGRPAQYRVKYAVPPISYASASTGCDAVAGTAIGTQISCTIMGLAASTTYDLQLAAYRLSSTGVWQGIVNSNVATGQTAAPRPAGAVADLSITAATDSSLTVRWTQVDDGKGRPASYRVKYDGPPMDYATATVACSSTIAGTQIGAPMSCSIQGLNESSPYEVQLTAFRMDGSTQVGTTGSNVAAGQTAAPVVVTPPQSNAGIWISPAEIAQLPTSGSAWNNLLSAANASCGLVDLADQEDTANVCVMAKALVYARTGQVSYRTDVVSALTQIVALPVYNGRALALGRELISYVIAADIIGLKTFNPTLDVAFRTAIRVLRDAPTTEAGTIRECHERRPNNWGTHCGATRVAIDAYLGDTADLARAAQVFKGWLGDRASYAGFSYGDTSWQCNANQPVGINPAGCTRNGNSIDGVIADDQRRAGTYAWPAPRENYVWEALQGALPQAVILYRAGYPVWDWQNRALLRAVTWLHNVNQYPAEGDDTWQPHIINRYYGTSFPAPTPSRAGKNVGWTDWTHR